MLDVSVQATWGTNRPLSALADLIEKRQKWLGESAKDSVISTAINCLGSLRTQTRTANKPAKPQSVRLVTELAPGWRTIGGRREKCIRSGHGHGNYYSRRIRWATGSAKIEDCRCYYIVPGHERDKHYLCVAPSQKLAEAYEKRRGAKHLLAFKGLARWAFGLSMNKVSTRNVNDPVSGWVRTAAQRFTRIAEHDGGGTYAIEITDAVDYATDALKNGAADVDLALMKAANKTYGILAHRCGDLLGDDFTTPFPEVKGRRR